MSAENEADYGGASPRHEDVIGTREEGQRKPSRVGEEAGQRHGLSADVDDRAFYRIGLGLPDELPSGAGSA